MISLRLGGPSETDAEEERGRRLQAKKSRCVVCCVLWKKEAEFSLLSFSTPTKLVWGFCEVHKVMLSR